MKNEVEEQSFDLEFPYREACNLFNQYLSM
jgi:hypothetical protein